MNKLIGSTFLTLGLCISGNIMADVPAGYYNNIDGMSGNELKSALRALSNGHAVITYNTKTWDAFEKTDVRSFQGRQVWWDMYSNNIVYTGEHGSMNIEHAAANSWWGGKNGSTAAYSDLYILNPSDAVANGKKGDYPPGEVMDARIYDNGLLKVGTPVNGQGGGSASVFEPADEYKGDFARAYFYIFTAYNDLSTWKAETQYVYDSDCSLKPWAVELLMKWHREDPVDSKEINRNEEIYKLQKNRNPFIDYPELAEYIWGGMQGRKVDLQNMAEAVAVDRPEAPGFNGSRAVGVNTYFKRWWDGFIQPISYDEGTLMLSIDGRDFYKSPMGELQFDPAERGDSHVIRAYVVKESEGYTLRSPISTLTLLARDPSQTEYSTARWQKLTADMPVTSLGGTKWIVISSNSNNAMSSNGGTTAMKYLEPAGLVEIEGGYLVELPMEAAVVEFQPLDGGKYRLMVNDIYGNYKGSWNATGKNAMKLDANTYTPGTWEGMGDNDTFKFRFDQYGSLLFNKTQVRYVNYEDNSNQTPVYLYKYMDMEGGMTGVEGITETPWGVGVDGNDLIAPEGARIFDLNGREVTGKNLTPGIYIVTGNGKSAKIRL